MMWTVKGDENELLVRVCERVVYIISQCEGGSPDDG